MRRILASIPQLFRLPAICSLCKQYHTANLAICDRCLASLPRIGPACEHCAHPLPDEKTSLCGTCCQKKPLLDRVMTAYRFEEPLRTLIHTFKYREGLHLTSLLTTLILHAVSEIGDKPDCLIPVPMHAKRIRLRGFNQSAMLTRQLARRLDIPYTLTTCRKIINTPPQAGLSAKARKTNLIDVFETSGPVKPYVVLIDDLLTTGSTANALAHTLKQQGAERVDLWCCARTGLLVT